jgi:hypothetical protein
MVQIKSGLVKYWRNMKDKMKTIKPLGYLLFIHQGVAYLYRTSIKDVRKEHFNYSGWLGS